MRLLTLILRLTLFVKVFSEVQSLHAAPRQLYKYEKSMYCYA